MRAERATLTALLVALPIGCQSANSAPEAAPVPPASGALAQVYYWRAKPGKFDDYSRYVRDVAEPIDREAQRRDAFVSVTTYMTRDTASAWTHMRVFILRDSAQLRALSAQLDSAGLRLEPDPAKRQARGTYSATLRDRVGAVTAQLLR
jgi:hypothetical protein